MALKPEVPEGLIGTLISGSPRSGTNLALKVLCEGITPNETMYQTNHNEPPEVWWWLLRRYSKQYDVVPDMNKTLPELLAKSRHRVIKSPLLPPLLVDLDPKYRIILTFRDIRLIAASMLHHKASQHLGLSKHPFWGGYAKEPQSLIPMSRPRRAVEYAETFTRYGVEYRGPLEVWSYGFWDEWECNNESLLGHYWQQTESPERIRDAVNKDKMIFSDASFSIDIWNQTREEFEITDETDQAARDANERMVKLYRERGFKPKTLDDS